MSDENKVMTDEEYMNWLYKELENTPTPALPKLPWRIKLVKLFIDFIFDHVYIHLPRWIIIKMAKKGRKLSQKHFDTDRIINYCGGQSVWDTPEHAEKGYSAAYELWRWNEIEKILGKRINPILYDVELRFIDNVCSNHRAENRFENRLLGSFAWSFFILYERVLCVVLWIKGYKKKTIPMWICR